MEIFYLNLFIVCFKKGHILHQLSFYHFISCLYNILYHAHYILGI